jgi:hypothetical protein
MTLVLLDRLISDLPVWPLIGRAGRDRAIGGERGTGLTGRQLQRFNVEGQLSLERTLDALLGRLRVERRANGDASSVMTSMGERWAVAGRPAL